MTAGVLFLVLRVGAGAVSSSPRYHSHGIEPVLDGQVVDKPEKVFVTEIRIRQSRERSFADFLAGGLGAVLHPYL